MSFSNNSRGLSNEATTFCYTCIWPACIFGFFSVFHLGWLGLISALALITVTLVNWNDPSLKDDTVTLRHPRRWYAITAGSALGSAVIGLLIPAWQLLAEVLGVVTIVLLASLYFTILRGDDLQDPLE
ncbi:hypothetical protein [Gallaecimonas mangrovi]|uniref:hypothetical protein n=1 Tax=Gallaecimonas mangrovi TaxID=2291597 RepID=UPI000E207D1F|nr:hypothetical protein [Gallaecimonas mangrovi]